MKIYTSYFSKSKALASKGVLPVSIALYPPKWYTGIKVNDVCPTYDILKNSKDPGDYTQRFKKEVLSRVNATRFYEKLISISRGKDIALCCYEKPEDFCHRHIVAEWLKEKIGIEVEEFGVSKNPVYVQPSLF